MKIVGISGATLFALLVLVLAINSCGESQRWTSSLGWDSNGIRLDSPLANTMDEQRECYYAIMFSGDSEDWAVADLVLMHNPYEMDRLARRWFRDFINNNSQYEERCEPYLYGVP